MVATLSRWVSPVFGYCELRLSAFSSPTIRYPENCNIYEESASDGGSVCSARKRRRTHGYFSTNFALISQLECAKTSSPWIVMFLRRSIKQSTSSYRSSKRQLVASRRIENKEHILRNRIIRSLSSGCKTRSITPSATRINQTQGTETNGCTVWYCPRNRSLAS